MELTVVDAGPLIALLDGADPHHEAAVAAFQAIRARGDRLILPASAYAETLVRPIAAGPDAVAVVDALCDALPLAIEPVSRAIAARAAAIRAGRATGAVQIGRAHV